jgi:O-antigen biosynthesis protein
LNSLLPTLGGQHEVIVVAHQAGDGPALEQVAASHAVRLIPYDGAFHFGVMNGLGASASHAQALCFLNDDVYPVTRDWLDSMLAQAARPDVGVVGALLLYPNGTIQHAGVAVGGWYLPAHVGRFRVESAYWPWLRMTREVTAVTGACMVVRRSVWDELGGFDPQFPVNYNDIDFCLRAGERGYRVLIEARAVLTHEESRTRIATVRPEESELFYQRWGSVMNAPDRYFNPQLGHQDDTIQLPSPWTLAR